MLQWGISNDVQISIDGLPNKVRRQIELDLTLKNPAHDAALKQNRSVYNIQEYIKLYRYSGDVMVIPRGYGRTFQEMLIRNEIQFDVHDKRLTLESVTFRSQIKLRPYQERAVQATLQAKQGGVVAPCGAGKTMILLEAMAQIRQPALWITHTTELAEQVIKRATEVLDITEGEIGRLYGGHMTIGERFTVCLVQTLNKLNIETIKDKFGAILVDEAHHMAATTFFHPVGQFPALYRLWASATPERSDGLTEMVFHGAGPIVHEIDQSEVPTVTPKLEIIETDYRTIEDDYVKLISKLIQDTRRNELIVKVIRDHAPGEFSLVLSDRIEHLETLHGMLAIALPEMRIEILTGSMKKRDRARVMERVQSKEVDILLATQLAREGLDVPHLSRLFLTTPKRAAAAIQQEVGRIARPDEGKQGAIVFDFWDSSTPILKQQFWKRREVYRKLQMDVQMNRRRKAN